MTCHISAYSGTSEGLFNMNGEEEKESIIRERIG